MSYDDRIDKEDWYDEDDQPVELNDESAVCPECGGLVYQFTNKCPACGYWITDADRRRLWNGESKPKWVLITATIILVMMLLGVLRLRF